MTGQSERWQPEIQKVKNGEHLSLGANFPKAEEMAEEEIEKLLDWMEATDSPALGGIEEVILRIRKRIGE